LYLNLEIAIVLEEADADNPERSTRKDVQLFAVKTMPATRSEWIDERPDKAEISEKTNTERDRNEDAKDTNRREVLPVNSRIA
jgi:hypothetical protein